MNLRLKLQTWLRHFVGVASLVTKCEALELQIACQQIQIKELTRKVDSLSSQKSYGDSV